MKNISLLVVASPKRNILPIFVKSIKLSGNREYIKEVIINPLSKDYNFLYKLNKFKNKLSKYDIQMRIVNLCNQFDSLGYCRKKLAEEASGKIISFVDDDIVLAPKWGLAINNAIENYKCNIVAGMILPPNSYAKIIKKSLSRYIARSLTVYNVWFTCRSKENIVKKDIMIIKPASIYESVACASGLWGANLSFEINFYKNIIKKINLEKLGYTGGKPIGGEDTKIVAEAFLYGGNVCLSYNAAAFHFTEPYKLSRKYLINKYLYISENYKYLIENKYINKKEKYKSLNTLIYGLNILMKEIINDISIKPFGIIDTLSIALIIFLNKIIKK